MGNGYAPTITIRDAEGQEIYRNSVPFLPQDNNMTSLGVIKVADGLPEQIGLIGFFYPTMQPLESGAFTSIYGELQYHVLTLEIGRASCRERGCQYVSIEAEAVQ